MKGSNTATPGVALVFSYRNGRRIIAQVSVPVNVSGST